MKFSVIVTIYNKEKYLHRCLNSILSQKYENFELILVDDGSNDASPCICDEYAQRDDRVRVIHRENGGIVKARKTGISAARGEYVVNVDADDSICEDFLDRIDEIISRTDPDVIAFGCTRKTKNGDFRIDNRYAEGYYEGISLEKIKENLIFDKNTSVRALSSILYGICLKAAKRALLKIFQLEVPDDIRLGDDLAVSAPMIAACNSLYIMKYYGYEYFENEDSLTGNFCYEEMGSLMNLTAFLDACMGKTYENQISVFTLYSCMNFLTAAAQEYHCADAYQKEMRENISPRLQCRICFAKGYHASLKQKCLIFLMKHQKYGIIYRIIRKRFS